MVERLGLRGFGRGLDGAGTRASSPVVSPPSSSVVTASGLAALLEARFPPAADGRIFVRQIGTSERRK